MQRGILRAGRLGAGLRRRRRLLRAVTRPRRRPGAARTTTSPCRRRRTKTVLGDFDGATFTYGDVTSRFFKRDGKFFVNTDGPDGKLADFEIRYTFGVYPLQQYLIAFPDGRMQALGIAWDSRPKDKGGQRWFHLYPDQKLAGRRSAALDRASTRPGTSVRRVPLDRAAQELRRGEEHLRDDLGGDRRRLRGLPRPRLGPRRLGGAPEEPTALGQRRRQRPHRPLRRARGTSPGPSIPATGNARRSTPRTSAKELETCGMCHSRSVKIAEAVAAGAAAAARPTCRACCEPGLFEADGKSLDEVYNYAPFRQSKMFMAGVSCSDCHDPHSLKLVADGNAVCEQCHDGQKYAATSHHHHADGSTGARCVACHMPARTYMIVDPRHDHAFRVPRPDESVRFGTSNACNDCHTDKDAAWAAAAVERWFGPERKGFQTWTETFAAARADKVEAAALLLKLAASSDAPSIARATAFESLALHPSREALTAAERGLADADPLVRLAALRTLRPFPVQQSWPLASRLLADPVLGVRIEAASLLASDAAGSSVAGTTANRLSRAIDDYVTAQRVNADRPEHRLNLGNLYAAAADDWPKPKRNTPPPALSTLASRRSMSALPSFMRNRAATPMASASCARR